MIKYTKIGGEIKKRSFSPRSKFFLTKITIITFLKESVFMGKPRLTHKKNKYKKVNKFHKRTKL
jgi:hypothetical protein